MSMKRNAGITFGIIIGIGAVAAIWWEHHSNGLGRGIPEAGIKEIWHNSERPAALKDSSLQSEAHSFVETLRKKASRFNQ